MQEDPPIINRPLTKLQRWGWNLCQSHGVVARYRQRHKIVAPPAGSFLGGRASLGVSRHEPYQ